MESIALALLLLLTGSAAHGHNIETSYTTVRVRTDSVLLTAVIDEYDLIRGVGLDTNGDNVLWRREMEAGIPRTMAYVEGAWSLFADGERLPLERVEGRVTPDNKGNAFLALLLRAPLAADVQRLEVGVDVFAEFGPDHRNLAKILLPGKPLQQAVFDPGSKRRTFVLRQPQPSILEGLSRQLRRWFE